ncbi:NUDIX hydrolase [Listeria aquatica]|uniref:NUDIX hydrolase n=1 Tax=Listeria aquatica TaxID=1494960 RepID=UPI003F7293FC
MKKTIKVEGFIYNRKRDEILAVRKRDLSWGLPSGEVEPDETMEEALVRVIKQETNIDISVANLLHCWERRTAWEHVCTFVFRAFPKGDFVVPKTEEIAFRVKWLSVPLADDMLPLEYSSLSLLLDATGAHYDHCNEFPANQ